MVPDHFVHCDFESGEAGALRPGFASGDVVDGLSLDSATAFQAGDPCLVHVGLEVLG